VEHVGRIEEIGQEQAMAIAELLDLYQSEISPGKRSRIEKLNVNIYSSNEKCSSTGGWSMEELD